METVVETVVETTLWNLLLTPQESGMSQSSNIFKAIGLKPKTLDHVWTPRHSLYLCSVHSPALHNPLHPSHPGRKLLQNCKFINFIRAMYQCKPSLGSVLNRPQQLISWVSAVSAPLLHPAVFFFLSPLSAVWPVRNRVQQNASPTSNGPCLIVGLVQLQNSDLGSYDVRDIEMKNVPETNVSSSSAKPGMKVTARCLQIS